MTHPNEELLRRGYAAFAAGDLDTVRAIFDDNIEWHTAGQGPLAGVYHGTDEVFGFFGRTFELSGGTFRVELHDVLANDRHAVALVTLRAERTGRTLESGEAHVWAMSDGRATQFWAMPHDVRVGEAFWAD